MTDDNIKQKAIALLNEVRKERGYDDVVGTIHRQTYMGEALCRAIEQREAYEQKVSDALEAYLNPANRIYSHSLNRFIIPKPKTNPLVEVIKAMRDEPTPYVNSEVYANRIHKKLDALGFEIREKANADSKTD
jgi:hypothetical protein